MVARHYDDEALASLLNDDRASSDAHLPSCTVCREKLEDFRILADALADADVWDTRPLHDAPVPETISNLRAFADQMTREDMQAEIYLRDLLAGPRDTWTAKLAQHPEWRTAGTVRKLIAATDRAIDTMPPDAVAMTLLATDIADHLDPAAHSSDTVSRLRGGAWREHAYALFYTGQFLDAERAVAIADAQFAQCLVDEYDRARVAIVQALVERAKDSLVAATATARRSAMAFATWGDVRREGSAENVRAAVAFRRGAYEEALQSWKRLEETAQDPASLAGIASNIASCYRELREFDQAIAYFRFAASVWEDTGNVSEAIRIRLNVAATIGAAGRVDEAVKMFADVRAQFVASGMEAEAAFCDVYVAEFEIAQEHFAEAEQACARAIASFNASGVGHTARALSALAYMREAAAGRRATAELARCVREYLKRLPAQPALLFAPPPPA